MEQLRRLPLVIVCLLGLAALPQGAGAAVVGVSDSYRVAGNDGGTYTADRGEINNLSATTERDESGTTWVVYDDSVPIRTKLDEDTGENGETLGFHCERPAPADLTVLRCTLDPRGQQEIITLGDRGDRLTWRNPTGFRFHDLFVLGNVADPDGPVLAADDDTLDVVDLASLNVTVTGGDGNDAITGSASLRRTRGMQASYYLHGRTFDAQFIGEEGNDTITCQTACAATGDGTSRAVVTEEDSTETGKDTLIGSPGPDYLNGSGGNDLIRGNAGDDHLCGEAGRDRIFGGPGNDLMSPGVHRTRSGPVDDHDPLVGGPGHDRVWPYFLHRPHLHLNKLIC